MVTYTTTGINTIHGSCLSSDTKPTDVDNGSTLLEMDTGKVYAYDAENEIWRDITQ